jgi:CheY-like chemotaxis protein
VEISPQPTSALLGAKVLIVDDNATNRQVLQLIVKRWGMVPTVVDSAIAGILEMKAAVAAAKSFDLVLSDLLMPDMDGFAFVERVRTVPEISDSKIIMLSSAGRRGDTKRCESLQISAYLMKPVRQMELKSVISTVLDQSTPGAVSALLTRFALKNASDAATSLRILVAEDNAVNQKLIVRLLEKRGHSVHVVSNGLEAVELLETRKFDLVLMDMQMQVMDGFEATREIRKRETSDGKRLPVVALTAFAMKGDRERCLDAGMDGYLTKPIRAAELDDVLRQFRSSGPEISQHRQIEKISS